jgi:hypothetical protein
VSVRQWALADIRSIPSRDVRLWWKADGQLLKDQRSPQRCETSGYVQKGTLIVAMMLLLGTPPTTLWLPTNPSVACPTRISAFGNIGSILTGASTVRRSALRFFAHTTISPVTLSPHWASAGVTLARSKAIGGVACNDWSISQPTSITSPRSSRAEPRFETWRNSDPHRRRWPPPSRGDRRLQDLRTGSLPRLTSTP